MTAEHDLEKGTQHKPFAGFEHPTANFIYTPNQFFDVCLRHNSRGVVRLVAYLLRRTLGWLDKNGEPIEQDIAVSYRELINHVGISRGAIRPAIDEAINAGFIIRTQPGNKGASGCAAQAAQYQLRWDVNGEYVRTSLQFTGFFAGEGHRTPIPNAFFDQVVVGEPLAVVKVVGTVLRHTVGYQSQFGGRRSEAPLSYSFIQSYANIKHRPTLTDSLRTAMAKGYVVRVQDGHFDPSGKASRAATYAVRWLGEAVSPAGSSKTEPVTPRQFKNRTGSGSESEPGEQFKNRTDRKTNLKDTNKQQDEQPAVAVDLLKTFQLLRHAGFDEAAARKLCYQHPANEIERQVGWIDDRNPSENRLGMLRKAIEERWSEPPSVTKRCKKEAARRRDERQQAQKAAEEAAIAERKRERRRHREALLQRWHKLSADEQKRLHRMAIQEASSDFLRQRLRRHSNLDKPPIQTLEMMGRSVASAVPTTA